MSQPADLEIGPFGVGSTTPPRHGFQGDRGATPAHRSAPLGLAIALSREAGARGTTIARKVAERLSWQIYDHELLEYMAQNPVIRQGMVQDLPDPCIAWVNARLERLNRENQLQSHPDTLHLAEVILSLAAQGQVVMVGRGAGFILPPETTLNVRVIAPLADRIAYMAQWQRLSTAEATQRVRQQDERRTEFVSRHFHGASSEPHRFDLILNSSLLSEEGCAELIARAAMIRWSLATEIAPLDDPES